MKSLFQKKNIYIAGKSGYQSGNQRLYQCSRLQNIMADNETMSERVKKDREWYQPKDDNTAEQPGWLEQKKADFHKVIGRKE